MINGFQKAIYLSGVNRAKESDLNSFQHTGTVKKSQKLLNYSKTASTNLKQNTSLIKKLFYDSTQN